jgi:hypothetical protein
MEFLLLFKLVINGGYMDITKAIEIIKAYGNNLGIDSMLETLQVMQEDEDLCNLDECAYNLFMHEGRKMFAAVKIKLEV